MANRHIQLGESFLDLWRLKDAAKAFDDVPLRIASSTRFPAVRVCVVTDRGIRRQ